MIELKQGSFPTNRYSLAWNEHSDFTRRIPTGLSQKQMARDAKIIKQIIRAWDEENDAEKVIDIFCNKARLLSNPRYWEVMRTVWAAAGSTETAQQFRAMMKSKRPCRGWFMTPEDAVFLDAQDFPLMVWRAWDRNRYGDDDPGIAWTLDSQWCAEYARAHNRAVKWRSVRREEIFAYISRRGENEIILLD